MKLLAIETSSEACSVAVSAADGVVAEHLVEARAHTRELVPMIRRCLGKAAVAPDQLDAVVLGNGPGSFIGMRIGASVAQGIAFAAGLSLVPVSSLAAIAAQVFEDESVKAVRVVQDARMGEVYCAEYERGENGIPIEIGATTLLSADELMNLSPMGLAGAAGKRHPGLFESLAQNATVLPVSEPDARFLIGLGRRDLDAGLAIDPATLEPGYVRQKVASMPAR